MSPLTGLGFKSSVRAINIAPLRGDDFPTKLLKLRT
jgi:hypothetical protein